MATVSTIPAVKAALVSLIAAEDTSLQVDYADQGQTGRRERCWIGNAKIHNSDPAALRAGKRRRREKYDLSVWVEVIGHESAEACEARAFAIAAVVEDVVSTDPKLGAVTNLLFIRMDGLEIDTTEVGGEGPRCEIEVSLYAEGDLL